MIADKNLTALYGLFKKIKEFPEEAEALETVFSELKSCQGQLERCENHLQQSEEEVERLEKVEEKYEALKSVSSPTAQRVAELERQLEKYRIDESWRESPDRMGQ